MSAGIIECDRSVPVDVGEERPAGIITAAIKIDRRGRRTIAPKNLESGIVGDSGGAGNVHVDRSVHRTIVPPVLSILESRLPPTDSVSVVILIAASPPIEAPP